jgi:glycosyltransferase involved in cell wall biosynthesis
MRVALVSRSSMYSIQGGDTIQVLKTAERLKKLGVKADVFRACEKIPYEQYDLMHYFNIIRPSDHLYHIKKSKKPYVVSTIYVDYTDFDNNRSNRFHKLAFGLMGQARSEYIKNLYRYTKKQDELVSAEYFLGHYRAIKKVLQGASMILPNSDSEFRRIVNKFPFSGQYRIVPNGVDSSLFDQIPENIQREDKVLCVAQIYGLKSQELLIRACQKLKVPLELVGSYPPNHKQYYDHCKSISDGNFRLTGFIPQEMLVNLYAGSKVHAMPSWFETTGLSSLEAGAMGCNLVVGTGGDTRDYYKNDSWFCHPQDPQSIEQALEAALNTPNSGILRETIMNEYTWDKAAKVTFGAYCQVLNNGGAISNQPPRPDSEEPELPKTYALSNQSSSLRIKILQSISYFDVFNHPLAKEEISNLCNGNEGEFGYELDELVKEQICYAFDNYYSLSKNVAELVSTREKKEIEAQKYIKKLPYYAKIIRSFPFVRAIAISGSLSKNIMHDDGDIDYFIITAKGRLWISRTLLVLFKKVFLFNSRKYFCVNYFVDEDNLKIVDENIFTAVEIAYMLPVYNSPLINKLKDTNAWVQDYFPDFKLTMAIDAVPAEKKCYKKCIERLFRDIYGDRVDLFFMKITFKRWVKKFKHFNASKFELTMRTNRGISKHHPQDYQNKVLKEYQYRLKKLNIN